MKNKIKDKKYAIALVFTLLVAVAFTVGYGTYAAYQSTVQTSGFASAASWRVKVNGSNIIEQDYFSLKGQAIGIGTPTHVRLLIDASGSATNVSYTLAPYPVTFTKESCLGTWDSEHSRCSFNIVNYYGGYSLSTSDSDSTISGYNVYFGNFATPSQYHDTCDDSESSSYDPASLVCRFHNEGIGSQISPSTLASVYETVDINANTASAAKTYGVIQGISLYSYTGSSCGSSSTSSITGVVAKGQSKFIDFCISIGPSDSSSSDSLSTYTPIENGSGGVDTIEAIPLAFKVKQTTATATS